MRSETDTNNLRLRELVRDAKLTSAVALTLFNRGLAKPVSDTTWRAWLAEPGAPRYQQLPEDMLQHARAVFAATT